MKTMSVGPNTPKIGVLQNINLQVGKSNLEPAILNQHKDDIYSNCLIYQRYTSDDDDEQGHSGGDNPGDYCNSTDGCKYNLQPGSSIGNILDEEPIFSDSDDEKENTRRVFESVGLDSSAYVSSKKRDVDVQRNLYPEESDILDLARKCASVNTASVNDDFKALINFCRELNCKYKYDKSSQKTNSTSTTEQNTSICNISKSASESEQLGDMTPSLENTNSYAVPENITLSRCGNSNGNNNALISETMCTSDKNVVNSSHFTRSFSHNGNCKINDVPVVRKSARLQKLVQDNNGIPPARRLPLPAANKKSKRSIAIKRNRTEAESKAAYKKVKSKISRRPPCRMNLNNLQITKNITTPSKIEPKKNVASFVRHSLQPISRINIINNYSVNPENLQADEDIRISTKFEPTKNVTSFARHSLQPKSMKNYNSVSSDDSGIACHQQKERRRTLYSPEKWLHSKDFNNLCMQVVTK